MQQLVEFLSGAEFVFGGAGLALGLVLVLALLLLMPRGQRRRARGPAALLGLYLAVVVALAELPRGAAAEGTLEVAAVFLLLASVGRAAFVLVVDWFLAHRLRRPLPRILRDVIQVLVFFAIAFVVLREAGAELGSLLTTSALLTAVIGLSLQETLGNLFAGLAIQAQHPFRVGHWIQLEGTPESAIGEVIEINWRATKILTNDRVEIVIPNGMLAKSPIRNFSEPSRVSRRLIEVQGPYEVPPHRVEAALLEAARGCPGVLEDPPPTTWVTRFAESGIDYTLVYFIEDFAARPGIASAVRRRRWYALRRAGVSVPFPVRDVRVAAARGDAGDEERSRIAAAEAALRAVYCFQVLPDAALARLARSAVARVYAAGEDLIRQGDEGAELFVLQRGSAAVLVAQEGREPAEVARLGPGAFVGEMSLVTGEARSATVRAVSPCECLVVSASSLRPLLEENPDLARRLSEVLVARQAELGTLQASTDEDGRADRSGLLLHRIRSFFSLWPGGTQPPPSRRG